MSALNMLLVTCGCILSHHTSAEVHITAQPAVAKFGKTQLKFNEKPSKTLENEKKNSDENSKT